MILRLFAFVCVCWRLRAFVCVPGPISESLTSAFVCLCMCLFAIVCVCKHPFYFKFRGGGGRKIFTKAAFSWQGNLILQRKYCWNLTLGLLWRRLLGGDPKIQANPLGSSAPPQSAPLNSTGISLELSHCRSTGIHRLQQNDSNLTQEITVGIGNCNGHRN